MVEPASMMLEAGFMPAVHMLVSCFRGPPKMDFPCFFSFLLLFLQTKGVLKKHRPIYHRIPGTSG